MSEEFENKVGKVETIEYNSLLPVSQEQNQISKKNTEQLLEFRTVSEDEKINLPNNDLSNEPKYPKSPITRIAIKTFLLWLARRFAFPLFSVKLLSAATVDFAMVKCCQYLAFAPKDILILEVFLKIAFGAFFLTSIKKEILEISKFLEKEFTVSRRTTLLFLIVFFVLLAFAVLFLKIETNH